MICFFPDCGQPGANVPAGFLHNCRNRFTTARGQPCPGRQTGSAAQMQTSADATFVRDQAAIAAGRWISLRVARSIGVRLLAFLPFARNAAFGAGHWAFAGIQRPLQLVDGGRAGGVPPVFEPAERFRRERRRAMALEQVFC